MTHETKDLKQAVLVAENNIDYLKPFAYEDTTAMLRLVNVSLIDYALEALNRSGIEEVFIYATVHAASVKRHVKRAISGGWAWSLGMSVQVIGGEDCRCFGDAMRDIDAKGLIRSNFVLLCADTVTNANLLPILEEHKVTAGYDKGAAATLIFKESATHIRTGNEIMIAIDKRNMRLYHHQRLRTNHKENHFEVPLHVFANNGRITLMHNLIDPQIAIASPSLLSLFSDNFDFQSRDDFIRGLLINEELLDSRIYVSLLPREHYAQKVNNWPSYQIVARDIINRWVYPMVPDMGIHKLMQQYVCQKNNIYRGRKSFAAKCTLLENVVLGRESTVSNTSTINNTVIGKFVQVGRNCIVKNSHIMSHVSIGENCILDHCVIGPHSEVGDDCEIYSGTVLGSKCMLPPGTILSKLIVTSKPIYKKTEPKSDSNIHDCLVITKIDNHAYIINDTLPIQDSYLSDSDGEDLLMEAEAIKLPKMGELPLVYEESDYHSSSDDDEDSSSQNTAQPDDANIFLSEVMDSLTRGYREKSKPDYLVLEINSSRYAYNMSLKEVNYNVVKAVFRMQAIREASIENFMCTFNDIFQRLGLVVVNYIKTTDAMIDCLRAIEDVCTENETVNDRIAQIVYYLYNKDVISEEAILIWYREVLDQLLHESIKDKLAKLVEWLEQSSDDDDDEEDDEREQHNENQTTA